MITLKRLAYEPLVPTPTKWKVFDRQSYTLPRSTTILGCDLASDIWLVGSAVWLTFWEIGAISSRTSYKCVLERGWQVRITVSMGIFQPTAAVGQLLTIPDIETVASVETNKQAWGSTAKAGSTSWRNMVAGRACSLIRWCLFPMMVSIWFRFSLVSDTTSSTRSSLIVNFCQVLYRSITFWYILTPTSWHFFDIWWVFYSVVLFFILKDPKRTTQWLPPPKKSWHEQPGYQWKSRLYLKEWDRAGWSPLLLLVLRRLVTCWGRLVVYPCLSHYLRVFLKIHPNGGCLGFLKRSTVLPKNWEQKSFVRNET